MHPRLSVIVPTYHDWDRLQLCLDALSAQTLAADCFEIIIANNAPSDPPPDHLRISPNVQIVPADRPGSYAARNSALLTANGALIAFTDSDCIPEPDWLENAVVAMEADQDIGVIAGGVTLFAKSVRPNIAEACDILFLLRQDQYAAAGCAATANVITRRSVFEAIGPFDDGLMSGGDMEWTKRAVSAGHRLIYRPDINIRHPARDTMAEILRKSCRVAGGQIASKRSGGRWFVLPQFDRLLPPLRAAATVYRSKDVGFWIGIGAWFAFYLVRIAILYEQIRLMFPRTMAKRV